MRYVELIGMRDTLVPGASHPAVASGACPGRIPVAENRVMSCRIAVSTDDTAITTATYTTSCRTPTAELTCLVGQADEKWQTRDSLSGIALLRSRNSKVRFSDWLVRIAGQGVHSVTATDLNRDTKLLTSTISGMN